jgi:regulator of replication initiation timing
MSETNNDSFKVEMIAEIKRIQMELKDIKKSIEKKPAKKTATKKKAIKGKPAKKTIKRKTTRSK